MAAKKQKLQSYLRAHTHASVSSKDANKALGPRPVEPSPTPTLDVVQGVGLCSLIGLLYGLLNDIPQGGPLLQCALGMCIVGGLIYCVIPNQFPTVRGFLLGVGFITAINAIVSVFVPIGLLWFIHIAAVIAIFIYKENR
jgi:hypothetical protein